MNESQATADSAGRASLDADAVAAYLENHPALLLERPRLLEAIELEHEVQGAASLVKRQVSQLRDANQNLRSQLAALIDNARANERLMTSLLDLSLAMAHAPDLPAQLQWLEQAMRDTFQADDLRLVLRAPDGGGELPEWVSLVAELPQWRGELVGRAVSCGGDENRIRARELGSALEGDTSWAIALLGAGNDDDPAGGGQQTRGLLALGSRDAERFTPGMSTDFLVQLGRMVGGLLKPPTTADN